MLAARFAGLLSFVVVGVVNAVIVKEHDYSYSWPFVLTNLVLLAVASWMSILGIKAARSAPGRYANGLFLLFFLSFLGLVVSAVIRHVTA